MLREILSKCTCLFSLCGVEQKLPDLSITSFLFLALIVTELHVATQQAQSQYFTTVWFKMFFFFAFVYLWIKQIFH